MNISEDVLTIVKKDLPFKWEVRQSAVYHSAYFAKDIFEFDLNIEALLDIFRLLSYDGVNCSQFFGNGPGDIFTASYLEVFSGVELGEVASRIDSDLSLHEVASALIWDNRQFELKLYNDVRNDYILSLICMLLMHENNPDYVLSCINMLSNDGRLKECRDFLRLINMKNISVNEDYLKSCFIIPCVDLKREVLIYALKNKSSSVLGLYNCQDIHDVLNDELVSVAVSNRELDFFYKIFDELNPDDSIYYSYIGALGDPSNVEFLIDVIAQRTIVSKYASEAFLMITGMTYLDEDAIVDDAHLIYEDDNYSAMLPLLDESYVKSWWHTHKHKFDNSDRYIMGQTISLPNLEKIKSLGNQKQRLIADLTLQSINRNHLRKPFSYNHARVI